MDIPELKKERAEPQTAKLRGKLSVLLPFIGPTWKDSHAKFC